MAVAGIDRWRGGWIVAEADEGRLELSTAPEIDDVVTRLARHECIAIDMPIALVQEGRRSAEAELRAVLGRSARSVFTSPTRAAIEAGTQHEATDLNRARGGPGISAQAFGLFASIRELRSALAGPAFNHWWETHPETAFAVMNGDIPLASKRTARGAAERLHLLRAVYDDIDATLLTAPLNVPLDDVLDAVAAAWSASRIVAGIARCYGPDGRDDQGFAEGIRI